MGLHKNELNDERSECADDLGPPVKPRRVRCLHCGQEYESTLIFWNERLWRCSTRDCDGAGFGFDIIPLDNDLED